MTATPHRQILTDAIRTRLTTITLAGGYNSDIGLRVSEWRDPQTEPCQDDELPVCYLRDTDASISTPDASVHEYSLTIEIGALDKGPDCPETMRRLEADLVTAIGVDPTFGGACHYFQPTNSRPQVNQGGDRVAGTHLTFEAKYRLRAFNPYELHEGPQ